MIDSLSRSQPLRMFPEGISGVIPLAKAFHLCSCCRKVLQAQVPNKSDVNIC